MKLDYNPATSSYILRVPRGDGDTVADLMKEHGLDFSESGSTSETAMLFTKEPYAAAAFVEFGTSAARENLKGITDEITKSYATTSDWRPSWVAPGRALWDFQRADLSYALARKHTLVGDQPGLGKTPIAIQFANEIQAKHVAVICPANIRLQWANKIREWSRMSWEKGGACVVNSITKGKHGVVPTDGEYPATWNIVSYDLARTRDVGRALAREHYDLLILDEAHYLKSDDSKRKRAVFGGGDNPEFSPIATQAQRVLALTGTPLPNRPREAYTLARGLCFDSIDWMSEDRFKSRFNPSILIDGTRRDGTPFRYVDERSGRHGELQARLRSNFMTRHLKREVMPQLKLPVFDLIQVEETQMVKQALHAERLLDIDPESLEGCDATVLGHIAVARRMMGTAMAPQVADYIEMLIDGGEDKLVLFAWHIEVLNILEERLRKHGVLRIDGSTSATQKQKRVERFIADRGIKVIIGNMQSMGVGTDGLQEVCWHGLIAEPSWTPGDNIQAFDRLDRGGQRNTVQGDIFVSPGSIAERILAAALRKLKVTDAALDHRFLGGNP